MFTVNNVVDPSRTIALQFTNTVSGNWHVTEIPAGSTLLFLIKLQ